MLLYHTGFSEIKSPDIHFGRANADFGQGFYLSGDEEFSKRWARERKGKQTYLNRYELDTEGLKIKLLSKDTEWFDYILGNRSGRRDVFSEYDVVIGPIANDTIYDTWGILTSGLVDSETALRVMMIGPAYEQIVIKSEKALSALRFISAEVLPHETMEGYRNIIKHEEEEFQAAFGKIVNDPDVIKYQDINARTIDRWIEEGWEWGRPITHDTYEKALNGEWTVLLTPTKPVPHEWFGELNGKKVLGLASGGGQQMPIFAALGADCTVLDYSSKQIESEKQVSEREGYPIRIIRGDMTNPLPFKDEEFDLIFHPVSNCYVEEVRPIWKECYRVLKHGGYLIAGTDHYLNYIVDADEKAVVNSLPFNPLKNPEQMKQLQDEDCGVQFSHSLEEQIGGQLEAGFRLLNIYEDTNGEGRLHKLGIPSFIAMRSVKE